MSLENLLDDLFPSDIETLESELEQCDDDKGVISIATDTGKGDDTDASDWEDFGSEEDGGDVNQVSAETATSE